MLRWVLGLLALLAAMVVASLTATPDSWQLAVQWTQQFDERNSGVAECPVLHGEAEPGSSLARYLEAIRLADGVRPDGQRLRELVEQGPAAKATAADLEMLALLQPAVRTLRQGAHRRGVQESGSSWFDFVDVLAPHDALLLSARDLAGAGDVRGAVHCLLDGLACGVDIAVHYAFWARLVSRTTRAFDDTLLQDADAAVLADLDAALGAIDAVFVLDTQPVSLAAAHMVRRLLDPKELSPMDLGMASSLVAWRHGFSVRESGKARAAALVELAQRFERSSPANEPWPQCKLRLQAAEAQERADNSDLHFAWLGGMVGIEETRREAAAQLRLLRLAVAFQRRQPLPRLADPLGLGELVARVHGDQAVFAGAGPGLERVARRRP